MSTVARTKLDKELQKAVQTVQGLHKEVQKGIAAHSQLEAQLNENKIVLDELALLTDESRVFKLVGPILVRQDLFEARDIVTKRLDYISGEMKRHEKAIKEAEDKQEVSRKQIGEIQAQYQSIAKK
ncbi:Prefoldin subunit 6-like [Oopsacas minuta]|uniref:Prefoldin subunit 6-like n=1 Tax=Oopsacas minuta TaxID=111878 RepID=A0AAV7K789_9METZ|nr:Prefoldin subunit 6-like [Oopsacas minuta]